MAAAYQSVSRVWIDSGSRRRVLTARRFATRTRRRARVDEPLVVRTVDLPAQVAHVHVDDVALGIEVQPQTCSASIGRVSTRPGLRRKYSSRAYSRVVSVIRRLPRATSRVAGSSVRSPTPQAWRAGDRCRGAGGHERGPGIRRRRTASSGSRRRRGPARVPLSATLSRAVRISTGVATRRWRVALRMAKPSTLGSIRSSTTRSGGGPSTSRSRAVAPSGATLHAVALFSQALPG